MKKNPNTKQFWDKLIIKNRKSLFESSIYVHKNKIVSKYLKRVSGRLLDVGVGYGYIENLLRKSKSKLSFYGIDISKEAIKQLNNKLVGDFKVAEINKIPFSSTFFDNLIVLDVLEHINESEVSKAYKEIRRVLKSKGLFIVSVPLNDSSLDKKLNGHVREYTPQIITKEISKNGFMVERTHLLYAFKDMYYLKTFFINLIPFTVKKPNLIIVVARKK